MKTVRFGLIGCGLMAREFASASARWCHLTEDVPKPEIVGICSAVPQEFEWFKKNFNTIKYIETDYRQLLNKDDIDVIYCAVPHNLHEQFYVDTIRSGKALLGEKPFGIDKAANDNIIKAYNETPGAFVRCTSEFPYYPAVQKMISWAKEGKYGKIISVKSGFCHSSDMDLNKPINWKRRKATNGEYGCLGDLGIHAMHVPFKLGYIPDTVYAIFSDIVKERSDGKGNMVPCDTYDNAVLLCNAHDAAGDVFPLEIETKRMDPGATNKWYLEIYGLDFSAKYTSEDPNGLRFTTSWGMEQAWSRIDIGYKPMTKTITGGIFEFGFVDAIQQMLAAFMKEYSHEDVPFGLFTVEDSALAHRLSTAAVESFKKQTVEKV